MVFVDVVLKDEGASILDLLETLVCIEKLPQGLCIFELLGGHVRKGLTIVRPAPRGPSAQAKTAH
jgi:hypothetical protein